MTALDPHARAAYEGLAQVYDQLTAGHDYWAWTRDLEALARAAGLDRRRLLDVACGTGKSFLPFLERGYEVTACDISPAMTALAAEKARGRARVEVHDMRTLPVLGEFDLVLCLDDAVNYLLDGPELAAALTGMAANLAPGGVLVFDVNCLQTYRGPFASLDVIQADELVIVWRGDTPADIGPGGRAAARTQVLQRTDDGAWTETIQQHLQRHHPEPTVRDAARAAGLRIVARYGMHPDGSFETECDELECSKAVYVAQHEAASTPREPDSAQP
jgi:SAM-dependent methyltransferase